MIAASRASLSLVLASAVLVMPSAAQTAPPTGATAPATAKQHSAAIRPLAKGAPPAHARKASHRTGQARPATRTRKGGTGATRPHAAHISEKPIIGPRQVVRAGHRDEHGRFVQTGVFLEPAPETYRSRGLDHLRGYLVRLTDPKAPRASLIVSTLDGRRSCLLMRDGPDVRVMESIALAPPAQADPGHGRKVRALFKSLGIEPIRDDIHEYNGVPDALEDLEYPIGHDLAYVAKVTGRLLREVHAVDPREGLRFDFEKAQDPAAEGATEFHSGKW